MKQKRKAFTLVEIVLVLIILGVLTTISTPNLTQSVDLSKQASVTAVIRTIKNTIALIDAQVAADGEVIIDNVTFLVQDTSNCPLVFTALSKVDSVLEDAGQNIWGASSFSDTQCLFQAPLSTGTQKWLYDIENNLSVYSGQEPDNSGDDERNSSGGDSYTGSVSDNSGSSGADEGGDPDGDSNTGSVGDSSEDESTGSVSDNPSTESSRGVLNTVVEAVISVANTIANTINSIANFLF